MSTRRITLNNVPGIGDADELKRVSEMLGSFFFSPDTMRFFRSRVSSRIYPTSRRAGYFVTSERESRPYAFDGPRLYSVRSYAVTEWADGSAGIVFDTVGDFQQYETAKDAHRAARSLAGNFSFVA